MTTQLIRSWPVITILGLLVFLLAGCAGLDLKETESGWMPAILQKDGSQMHYLRPPVSTWDVFRCPEFPINSGKTVGGQTLHLIVYNNLRALYRPLSGQ